ncbi:unnamed protein product [Adineta steineri]|uniref:Pentapeptide repeat protein n=1 Tax=Adineta steineri TaxID=433720 RepID=A0A814KSA2_9BILA|nr:unnamed protein product [Adineta steineri]
MKSSKVKSNDLISNRKWYFHCIKLLMSACLPIILGVFTLIYTIQQNQIAKDNRLQDERQANEIRQQNIYDKYLEDITKYKSDGNINLEIIRLKTLNAFSQLDIQRKRSIILFLYDIGFIHRNTTEKERLRLDGADLTGVKFIRSSTFHCQLDNIYLSGILASNIIFSHCRMWYANFDQALLINAQFINCSMSYSSFVSADISQAKFIGEANNAERIDFSNSKLIEMYMSLPMRNANLTNTDTFNSQIIFSYNASRVNYFLNTRLPNGTFSIIGTSQLIQDGSAETEYQKYWLQRSGYNAVEQSNESEQIPDAIDGKSYFKLFFNSRAFQDINVRHCSFFIDSDNAWFNLSAYLACPFSQHRKDITNIYLRFYDENLIGIKTEILESNYNQTSFKYQYLTERILPHTRQISVFIGTIMNNSTLFTNINNNSNYTKPYCLIDDMKFNIFKNIL